MAYSPINVGAFVAAYSGAISGMATSGWLIDPVQADYALLTQIAGAFAQAFDTVWANEGGLNALESEMIAQVAAANFAQRGPGPQTSERFSDPANWLITAGACAALVLQSDSYFAEQGINPGGGGGGGGGLISFNGRTDPDVIPTEGDYLPNFSTAGSVSVNAYAGGPIDLNMNSSIGPGPGTLNLVGVSLANSPAGTAGSINAVLFYRNQLGLDVQTSLITSHSLVTPDLVTTGFAVLSSDFGGQWFIRANELVAPAGNPGVKIAGTVTRLTPLLGFPEP